MALRSASGGWRCLGSRVPVCVPHSGFNCADIDQLRQNNLTHCLVLSAWRSRQPGPLRATGRGARNRRIRYPLLLGNPSLSGNPDLTSFDKILDNGLTLLGSGVPPESLRPHWAVSLASDPLAQVQGLLPQLLQGQGGQNLPLPLGFAEVNPDLFSPGKQRLAEQMLADLLADYIDTGVDPSTGENK